jgi:hypothetical protein
MPTAVHLIVHPVPKEDVHIILSKNAVSLSHLIFYTALIESSITVNNSSPSIFQLDDFWLLSLLINAFAWTQLRFGRRHSVTNLI